VTAAGKTPCTDTFSKSGCAITSLAMVLDFLDKPIDVYDANGNDTKQLPTPLTLDYWLNAQTYDHGKNLGLINAQSCGINLVSGAMTGRLHISVKKLPVHIQPYAWYQTQGKGNVFNSIAGYIRQGDPVIAEVPGNPKTHFVVITGWETWAFSGKSQWGKSEFGSQAKVRGHFNGIMGDFIISDPEAHGPRTHLFATYSNIMNLYAVKPA
jgi:uncharacterized protein YvpB